MERHVLYSKLPWLCSKSLRIMPCPAAPACLLVNVCDVDRAPYLLCILLLLRLALPMLRRPVLPWVVVLLLMEGMLSEGWLLMQRMLCKLCLVVCRMRMQRLLHQWWWMVLLLLLLRRKWRLLLHK